MYTALYLQDFVILITGNWITKVFLYQRNEVEFFIMTDRVAM